MENIEWATVQHSNLTVLLALLFISFLSPIFKLYGYQVSLNESYISELSIQLKCVSTTDGFIASRSARLENFTWILQLVVNLKV